MLKLLDRSVFQITGKDATKLLQGLTTNNVNKLVDNTMQYTAFLNHRVSSQQ